MPTAILTREGALAILTIDNPPVNALSADLVRDLKVAFDAFEADTEAKALVVECKGRTFIAGGDIGQFNAEDFSAAPLNGLLDRFEASTRPVVVALHGTVLGGGLEVALACHLRVADPKTRTGFPEITIGLIPGSLGTQRAPRAIGLAASAKLMSSGKPISAAEAQSLGLFDELSDTPAQTARARALELAESGAPLKRLSTLAPVASASDAADLAVLAAEGERLAHLPAHAALARALSAAYSLPYREAEAVEAKEFTQLVASTASRALRHIFFADREAKKIPGLPRDLALREIKTVGILGVGTMGAGIAMAFANAGFPVTLVETTDAALERGRGIIEKTYASQVSRGRLSQEAATARLAQFTGTTDTGALGAVDIVIEAVFEDMALKLQVAEMLGKTCKPGAIIATNTSTLDVDRIAQATGRAGDVVGTHFFSPAHVMRLLEVVQGRDTDPQVLATVMALAPKIGKTAVVSGVCYGFIGNRMAEVYMRESEAMQLEGATPSAIDGTVEDPAWLGLAMGPSRMLDMAGVDVGARTVIEWIKSGEGPQDPAYRILCRTMFERGLHGQKTGEGYYRHEGKTAHPSQKRADLAAELAAAHGVAQRDDITPEEMFERLLFPMINEAALILEEGIAFRGSDIDVVWTAGYGFPSWRGGPMFMADEIGLQRIVERIEHYAARYAERAQDWQVAPLLRRLAAEGGSLAGFANSAKG